MYRGNGRCEQSRCKVCADMKMGTTVNSTTTDERFLVKATADYQIRNVVYLVECRKCAIQYVGETEKALQIRLTGYRLDLNYQRTERPVAKHLTLLYHALKDLLIMVIKKICREDADYQKQKESCWIEMIRSLTPDGLNLNA